jgi:hypothetical protein
VYELLGPVYGKYGKGDDCGRCIGDAENNTFGKDDIKIKNCVNKKDYNKQHTINSSEKQQRNKEMNKSQFKFCKEVFRREKEDKSADAVQAY